MPSSTANFRSTPDSHRRANWATLGVTRRLAEALQRLARDGWIEIIMASPPRAQLLGTRQSRGAGTIALTRTMCRRLVPTSAGARAAGSGLCALAVNAAARKLVSSGKLSDWSIRRILCQAIGAAPVSHDRLRNPIFTSSSMLNELVSVYGERPSRRQSARRDHAVLCRSARSRAGARSRAAEVISAK